MRLYFVPLLFALMSCGSIQKMGIRSASPVLQNTSYDLMKEGNWKFLESAMPGNLKLMELLWEQDKNSEKLLSVLVKGYAGYAFAVPETLAFGDELQGVDESPWKKEAIFFYTRALDFGLRYLSKQGVKRKDLLGDEEKLKTKLNQKLGDDDVMALLYTAQSWGSLINLQKDNVALVSQIPKVKVLFDWVCKKNPDIDQNVCDIFYAQYEASRPKMLGGNPEKAQKLYQESMSKNPQNLLIRMSYIQYLLLPAFDQERYEKEASFLKEEFAKWEDMNRDELTDKSSYRKVKNLNLYNAVAKKRFEFVEKYKIKIF